MMGLSDMLSMLGSGGVAGFSETYRVYSVAMAGKPGMETGDKILLPPSALAVLSRMAVQYPMHFRLENPTNRRVSHCGVMEFSAEEGRCYMPYWMMSNLVLPEGSLVDVRNVQLPKAKFVKFQPNSVDFLDISNPKAVLERQLRTYTALTKGDTLMFRYMDKNYYLKVLELKPADACSIVETDCVVDFAPPEDYVSPRAASKAPTDVPKISAPTALAASGAGASPLVGGAPTPSDATPSSAAATAALKRARSNFTPFAGEGYRVGTAAELKGSASPGAPSTPALAKSVSAGGVVISSGERPSSAKPRTLNKFEQKRAEASFTGTARSLRG